VTVHKVSTISPIVSQICYYKNVKGVTPSLIVN